MEHKLFIGILAMSMLPFFHCKNQSNFAKEESNKTPLEQVMAGNARFASVHSMHPHENAGRSSEVAQGQHPVAVVITCSDSRVSPELIFDEGLGDLFVIRTAGNIIGEAEYGSVEYAVEHLNVPLVIVMGHERCGAIQAMIDGTVPSGHLQSIIDSLRHEVEMEDILDSKEHRLEHCITTNILHGVHALYEQSPVIREKVQNKSLKIVGAHYDLDDRKVNIIY